MKFEDALNYESDILTFISSFIPCIKSKSNAHTLTAPSPIPVHKYVSVQTAEYTFILGGTENPLILDEAEKANVFRTEALGFALRPGAASIFCWSRSVTAKGFWEEYESVKVDIWLRTGSF
jgi:hypothetical protein